MQDLFEFPNTILYNSPKKSTIPQCSLKRNFTEYAKRYQKIANYIRRNPPYSLWWNIFNSLVLPKTQTSNNEIFCCRHRFNLCKDCTVETVPTKDCTVETVPTKTIVGTDSICAQLYARNKSFITDDKRR